MVVCHNSDLIQMTKHNIQPNDQVFFSMDFCTVNTDTDQNNPYSGYIKANKIHDKDGFSFVKVKKLSKSNASNSYFKVIGSGALD